MLRFVCVLTAVLMAITCFVASISVANDGNFPAAIFLLLLAAAWWIIGEIAVPASFKKEMR